MVDKYTISVLSELIQWKLECPVPSLNSRTMTSIFMLNNIVQTFSQTFSLTKIYDLHTIVCKLVHHSDFLKSVKTVLASYKKFKAQDIKHKVDLLVGLESLITSQVSPPWQVTFKIFTTLCSLFVKLRFVICTICEDYIKLSHRLLITWHRCAYVIHETTNNS